jgi:hypothetical protein
MKCPVYEDDDQCIKNVEGIVMSVEELPRQLQRMDWVKPRKYRPLPEIWNQHFSETKLGHTYVSGLPHGHDASSSNLCN